MFEEPEEKTVDNVELWLEGFGVSGVIDLRLPDLGWPAHQGLLEKLRGDRRPVPERGLRCRECRDEGRPGPMYLRQQSAGIRGVHFNPGDSEAHPSGGKSPEHEAYQYRYVAALEARGHPAETEFESVLNGKKIYSDVVADGPDGRRYAIETQRSPQTAQTTRHRSILAAERGLLAVWHTDKRSMSNRNEVAWLRTEDDLPLWVIERGPGLKFSGGARAVDGWELCERRAQDCPKGNGRRCKLMHPNFRNIAPLVDDFIPGIAEGRFVPVEYKVGRETVRFWTPAEHRTRLEEYTGTSLEPSTAEPPAKPEAADPHAAASCTQRGRAAGPEPAAEAREHIEIHAAFGPCVGCGRQTQWRETRGGPHRCWRCKAENEGRRVPVAPVLPPVVRHCCDAGVTPCGAPARLYPAGWLCDEHAPWAVAGKPNPVPLNRTT